MFIFTRISTNWEEVCGKCVALIRYLSVYFCKWVATLNAAGHEFACLHQLFCFHFLHQLFCFHFLSTPPLPLITSHMSIHSALLHSNELFKPFKEKHKRVIKHHEAFYECSLLNQYNVYINEFLIFVNASTKWIIQISTDNS